MLGRLRRILQDWPEPAKRQPKPRSTADTFEVPKMVDFNGTFGLPLETDRKSLTEPETDHVRTAQPHENGARNGAAARKLGNQKGGQARARTAERDRSGKFLSYAEVEAMNRILEAKLREMSPQRRGGIIAVSMAERDELGRFISPRWKM